MDSRARNLAGVLAATAASAALYFFATGLHPYWFLTWIAPLPILIAAARTTRWIAALAAFAAFALGELNMVAYARAVIPAPIIVLLVVGPALLFAAFVLVFRGFLKRGQPLAAALSLPVLWVAFEYLTESASPHSTFGNLAYTQMDTLPVIQIAAITGIWSISFLLFLFPAAIATITAPSIKASRKRIVAVGTLAVFAAVLSYGGYRLASGPRGPSVTVGLIDSDAGKTISTSGAASVELVRAYAEHIPELARQGAQVIVIPEKIGRFDEQQVGDADRILEQAASDNRVTIVAGMHHLPNLNESRVYSPQGALEATYEKHHMLPAFESDQLPGTTRTMLSRPSGKWGLTICKDMDFPRLSRQYGSDGAGLLLVPAWDFVDDGWLHGRMAILRGVESGFSMARAVKQGILTVSDDRGRVLAERTTGQSAFDTLIASVPVENEPTFYDRAGDWFACVDLGLVAMLVVLGVKGRSARTASV